MALNRHQEEADSINMPVPQGTESGDGLVIGALPCVALIDRQADGTATVDCDGSYFFNVDGEDGSGNHAIAAGDIVYKQNDGTIDADAGGKRFGYAMSPVLSGASTKIPVKIGY